MSRKTIKKHKIRRGGADEEDIEMGRITPVKYIEKLPPRPERIREHELRQYQRSFNPLPATEVAEVFNRPTPEQRAVHESTTMMDEDPRFQEPFQREPLEIFKRGGKKRQSKKRGSSRRKRATKRKQRGGKHLFDRRLDLRQDKDFEPVSSDMEPQELPQPVDPRLLQLRTIIQNTVAHIEQLDSRLDVIEQMPAAERQQHRAEEQRIQSELRHLIHLVQEYQERVGELFD